jgi:hypothetical protein
MRSFQTRLLLPESLNGDEGLLFLPVRFLPLKLTHVKLQFITFSMVMPLFLILIPGNYNVFTNEPEEQKGHMMKSEGKSDV